ncbi:MAG: Calx-beta domain-containing protein [Solirubrobacteraceae bacterium]|nr:Calx-beta domain-containing protein [Solirubrobacteraceae bacterium]
MSRPLLRSVFIALCSSALLASSATAAIFEPAPPTEVGAQALASAMTMQANIGAASFVSVPRAARGSNTNGTGAAKWSHFPSSGASRYAVLTNGLLPSLESKSAVGWRNPGVPLDKPSGGWNAGSVVPERIRGGTPNDAVFDATVLKVPFSVPVGANCLTFDFTMYSAEFPNWVGNKFNDAFIAEIDRNDWTLDIADGGATFDAPGNFAYDAAGRPVTVNTAGFTQINAASTGYSDYGATGLLSASRAVTPGMHDLYLSIMDAGDPYADSGVVMDALRVGFVPNPSVNCKAGAAPVFYTLAATPQNGKAYLGDPHTVVVKVQDLTGAPVKNKPVRFTVAGANPETATQTTDANGVVVLTTFGSNAGEDQIAACFAPDGDAACKATTSVTLTREERPTASIGAVTAAEGNAGTTTLTFPVTLDKPATTQSSVSYTTANGTATAGTDYVSAAGTVTFAKGQTTKTVSVVVNGDRLVEPDETFTLSLTPATVVTVAPGGGSAVGTITNDDVSELSIAGVDVGEAAASATLTISSVLRSSKPQSVSWTTADGTATAGADYVAASGQATIAAGATQTTITVPITADLLVEDDETLLVKLSNPSTGSSLAAEPQATVTITDDDSATLSIDDVTLGENGGPAKLTITSTNPSAKPITAAWTTTDGTAVAGQDYTTAKGIATIDPGKQSTTIEVTTIDDDLVENEETFAIALSAPTGASLAAKATATVTLTSDDLAPLKPDPEPAVPTPTATPTPTPTATPAPTPTSTPTPTPAPTSAPVPTSTSTPVPVPDQQQVLGESVKSALCGRSVTLLDVSTAGNRVRIGGLALLRYAGQTVRIRAGSKVVGETTVGADGAFSATVPAPSAAARSTVRYSAGVAKVNSQALKLERRLVITKRIGLTVRGRLVGFRAAQLPRKVTFYRQLTCTKTKVFASAKVAADGRFQVKLARPAQGELYALFRVTAKAGALKTFTLPIAVRRG